MSKLKIPVGDAHSLELDLNKMLNDVIAEEFPGMITGELTQALASALERAGDRWLDAEIAKINATP